MKIAIIGAGIAGLTAATLLKEAGQYVQVFEKARGPGGRTSTRRTDHGDFDHGAQYFTMRDQNFVNFLADKKFKANIAAWQGDFRIWKNGHFEPEVIQDDRYVFVPGMNALCKAMAALCPVSYNTRVSTLEQKGFGWNLHSEAGEDLGIFERVISTAPPAQSFELLHGKASFTPKIQSLKMTPCYTLMLSYADGRALPHDSVKLIDHSVLGWASNNHTKPGRGSNFNTIVLQTAPEWSWANINTDRSLMEQIILKSAEEVFGMDLKNPALTAVHGWLYSSPQSSSDARYYHDSQSGISACGDWCLGARIECAFLSAYSLVQDIYCHSG
jgi:predicted NAD/FAD-dependent oxidoreductase